MRQRADLLIDDFSGEALLSPLGTRWRAVSDQVMGGTSQATAARDVIEGRPCLRLTGDVRLDHGGGFLQAVLDLDPSRQTLDASRYAGVRITVRGNDERYAVNLRTPDNVYPWQSYRAAFTAGPLWATIDLPFSSFAPHRIEAPLDRSRLLRIGLLAVGRAFRADLAVGEVRLFQ